MPISIDKRRTTKLWPETRVQNRINKQPSPREGAGTAPTGKETLMRVESPAWLLAHMFGKTVSKLISRLSLVGADVSYFTLQGRAASSESLHDLTANGCEPIGPLAAATAGRLTDGNLAVRREPREEPAVPRKQPKQELTAHRAEKSAQRHR